MLRMLCALSLAAILCAVQPTFAQQSPVDKEELKKLQAEMDMLRSQVQDLETRLKKLVGEDAKNSKGAFRFEKVVRGRLVATVSATGTLQAQEVVDVGAQVQGRVVSIGADKNTRSGNIDWGSEVEGPVLDKEGKIIKLGTVLAQIDPTLYEAQRNVAKASVLSAKASLMSAEADVLVKSATFLQASRDWTRAEALIKPGAISQEESDRFKTAFELAKANLEMGKAGIEVAQAQVGVAEINLKSAQTNLDYCTITAPVSGKVVDRRVNVGQTVVASLSAPSLFLIAKDLTKLEVWASVNDEVDIGRIKIGQEVNYTFDAFPARVFHGKVVPQGKVPYCLDAAMYAANVTYTVVVSVDNKDELLKPYMTAHVSFIVENKENALLVPNAALRWQPAKQQIVPGQRESYFQLKNKKRSPFDQDCGFIWVRGADGFVYYIQVGTGMSDGSRTEILSVIGDEKLPEHTPVIVGESGAESSRNDASNPFSVQMFKSRNPEKGDGARPTLSDQENLKKLLDETRKRANELLVMPGITSSGGVSFGSGSVITLTPQDADAIARECPAVASVAKIVRARTQITFGNKNWVPNSISGTTPSFLEVRDWVDLEEGEPFTDADVRNQKCVCLIGQTIKRELFDDKSPLGRELRIQNVAFKVVGVLSARGPNFMGMDQDDIVLAPWTAIKQRVSMLSNVNQNSATKGNGATTVNSLNKSYPGSQDSIYPNVDPLRASDYPQQTRFTNLDSILVRARSKEAVPLAIRQITDLLHQRHHIKSGQPDDFIIRDMSEMLRILDIMEQGLKSKKSKE